MKRNSMYLRIGKNRQFALNLREYIVIPKYTSMTWKRAEILMVIQALTFVWIPIFDMEKKENLVKFLAILGKHGSVRSETLETIPADMFYRISKDI